MLYPLRPGTNCDQPPAGDVRRILNIFGRAAKKNEYLCVGGVIVARPVDLDFHGNDRARAVGPFSRQTNSIP